MYIRRMIGNLRFRLTTRRSGSHQSDPGARKGREVQVEMRERVAGTSYLNLPRSIGYMLQMAVSIWLFSGSAVAQSLAPKGRRI